MDPTLDEASCPHTLADRLRLLAHRSEQHRLLIAANPAAPPDLLERFVLEQDPQLQARLATNPALPTPLFWHLAQRFPREILENPLFGLLLLDLPALAEVPPQALLALLGTGQLPEAWFWLVYDLASQSNWGLLFGLAELDTTPRELLLKLLERHKDLALIKSVLRRKHLPPQVLEQLLQRPDASVQVLLAESPLAPPEWLASHIHSPHEALRLAIAAHPRSQPQTIEALLDDPSGRVRLRAVQHASLSENRVLQALKRGFPGLRRPTMEPLIQRNGDLLRAALRAHDGGRSGKEKRGLRSWLGAVVKPSVLRRSALLLKEPEGLELLARSPCLEVRLTVALNAATAPATLAILAADRRHEVRRAVAKHPATPEESLRRLQVDPIQAVRKAAAR
jgi:hypothetical protein